MWGVRDWVQSEIESTRSFDPASHLFEELSVLMLVRALWNREMFKICGTDHKLTISIAKFFFSLLANYSINQVIVICCLWVITKYFVAFLFSYPEISKINVVLKHLLFPDRWKIYSLFFICLTKGFGYIFFLVFQTADRYSSCLVKCSAFG